MFGISRLDVDRQGSTISGKPFTLVLEPITQQFVDSLAGKPPFQGFLPEKVCAALVRAQSGPTGKPRARTEDMVFPVGPTGSVEVRIIRPPNASRALPIIMLFHAGGSILGDKETHDRFMREIAIGVGAEVIFVGYGRVPENRFPVAIEQAYAATRYGIDEARALNLDAARLAALCGSIGGNIAAVVALMAKERRGPKIDLQVLLYRMTDADFTTRSYRRFADGPWLTGAEMMWFWGAYLPASGKRGDSKATPLNARLGELRYLPDALVIVAEADVLCDEGEAYARKLADAGVRVTSVRYNGTIHDFVLLHALADTLAVRSATAQTICACEPSLSKRRRSLRFWPPVEAYGSGQRRLGLETINVMLERCQQTEERWVEPELTRVAVLGQRKQPSQGRRKTCQAAA